MALSYFKGSNRESPIWRKCVKAFQRSNIKWKLNSFHKNYYNLEVSNSPARNNLRERWLVRNYISIFPQWRLTWVVGNNGSVWLHLPTDSHRSRRTCTNIKVKTHAWVKRENCSVLSNNYSHDAQIQIGFLGVFVELLLQRSIQIHPTNFGIRSSWDIPKAE